jgi:hypothetical protein
LRWAFVITPTVITNTTDQGWEWPHYFPFYNGVQNASIWIFVSAYVSKVDTKINVSEFLCQNFLYVNSYLT